MEKQNENVLYLSKVISHKQAVETFPPTARLSGVSIYPQLWKKVFAFGIDFSVILTAHIAVNLCYAAFLSTYFFMLNDGQMNALFDGNMTVQFSVLVSLYFSYFLFCNYTLEGKTAGKMIMNLRSISDHFIFERNRSDPSMNLSQAIKRSFSMLICYLSFGTFFSFSFFSEDKRGLQDMTSGTRTVTDEWLASVLEQRTYESELIFIDIKALNHAA